MEADTPVGAEALEIGRTVRKHVFRKGMFFVFRPW